MKQPVTETVLLSYTEPVGGAPLLIIGKKDRGKSIQVINVFQGDEAKELYMRLITKHGKEDNDGVLN